ncbi:MAG: methylmalonyl-CoA mutase [Acidimicrobiia bacterium]|nr:methylmalonyl-CoA mutase [Acidimicrobiia bacterium]
MKVMSLAGDFDLVGREQWMDLVTKVLKGAHFDKALTHTTYDGIQIQPLYTGADHAGDDSLPGQFPFTRGSDAVGGVWQVRQAHSRATGNSAVLEDLAGGVDAIELHIYDETSLAELQELLIGVPVTVPIMLAPGSEVAISPLCELWESWGVPKEDTAGGFGMNPRDPQVGEVVTKTLSLGCESLLVATVNAAALADQGATEAQELAGSLADGVAYLRHCEQADVDLAVAAGKLEFRYTAGVDQFLTIAKLRAARRLWARVAQACGLGPVAQRQHVVTAGTIMTRRDPWVNMIRTTVACFAAAVGGANSVSVSPFDAAIGVPDPLGLRIARNTQLLLREESHIGQVIDPAGGSYYVESLTDALVTVAWGLFQEISAGASLDERITLARSARAKDIATRKLPLTGISEFPDLAEETLTRLPWAEQGSQVSSQAATSQLPQVSHHRLAACFEALRDAADESTNATGQRPQVFLASLGPLAVHNVRSTFATNFLAAGGIGVMASEGFASAELAAQAWADSGSSLAVVCASDAMYQDHAATTVSALKAAGCRHVLLAGRPDDRWGADGYIYLGCDVLAVLQDIHKRLS